MTDNGSCYQSKMYRAAQTSPAFATSSPRPYTLKTQRRGRMLHPKQQHCAMGLRSCLKPQLGGSAIGSSCPTRPPSLQLASARGELESQNTYQSPRSTRGQTLEAPQRAGLVWSDSRGRTALVTGPVQGIGMASRMRWHRQARASRSWSGDAARSGGSRRDDAQERRVRRAFLRG